MPERTCRGWRATRQLVARGGARGGALHIPVPGLGPNPALGLPSVFTRRVGRSPAPQPAFERRDPGPSSTCCLFATSCLTVLGKPHLESSFLLGRQRTRTLPTQPLGPEEILPSPRLPNSPALSARDDLPSCGFEGGKNCVQNKGNLI